MKPLILIIDNIDDSTINSNILEDDYDVVRHSSESDAITYFERHCLQIRVVLIRYDFGNNNGLELLKKFKKISGLPEFIIFSEQKNIQNVDNTMKEGAVNYIVLPIDDSELKQSIAMALDNLNYVDKIQEYTANNSLNFIEIDRRIEITNNLIDQSKESNAPIKLDGILPLYSSTLESGNNDRSFIQDDILQSVDSKLAKNNNAKVLIVEDEEVYRQMMVDFISGQHKTYEAGSVKDSLDLLREQTVDVVILDIFLPDGLGSDAVKEIKAIQPDAEIIMVTAFELIDKAVQALRDGASDYLNKPILKDTFVKVILQALERKYIKSVVPEVRKEFIEKKLTDKTKISMILGLFKHRKTMDKPLLMEDIFMFFPDLKETYIPPTFNIPDQIVLDGLESFIEDLRSKIGSFKSTPS